MGNHRELDMTGEIIPKGGTGLEAHDGNKCVGQDVILISIDIGRRRQSPSTNSREWRCDREGRRHEPLAHVPAFETAAHR